MKLKKLMPLAFGALVLLPSMVLLTACNDDPPAPTQYNITVQESADYEVTIQSTAIAGDRVYFDVELLNGELELAGVYYNGTACEEAWGGGYRFTMPESDVTITVETSPLQEVTETDFVWLTSNNMMDIAVAGEGTSSYESREFLVAFDAPYMTILGSDVTSTNQSVIPNDAITIDEITLTDLIGHTGSNVILQAKILIDPSKISVGSTMIIANFDNGNSSGEGTLIFRVNVHPYGEVQIPTMKETLVFDLSGLDSIAENYTIRVGDDDHVDGGNLLKFTDYVLQPVDGKLTLEIDYAIGHDFWLRISEGEVDNYNTTLDIGEKIISSGDVSTGINGYAENKLTFKDANLTLELDVIEK